ncbi:MAG TPA: hypothetical protein VN643_16765 [Pyrinomonadaceae bacterium]|nr:hypothetical protein [Pyrinomonadaceae bacterium]
MKFKTSTSCLALLCGSLLLFLSSTSAQKQKSSTPKPKSAPSQTPTPTPPPSVQGSFALVNATTASDTVKKAIEEAVKPLKFSVRVPARYYLKKTNIPPYQKIVISCSQAGVSITTDKRAPIRTSSTGSTSDWTREDGENFKVSTVCEYGKLRQVFQGSNGQRVNTYSIADDDKTLTMQVTITSEKLQQPLKYQLSYSRN